MPPPLADRWLDRKPVFLERVATLEVAAAAVVTGRLGEDLRAVAAEAAHKIAGSSPLFGLDDAAPIARRLERMLIGDEPDDDGSLGPLVQRLRLLIEAGPAPALIDTRDSARLVVIGDDDMADALEVEAGRGGLHVARPADGESLRAALVDPSTIAVVVARTGKPTDADEAVLEAIRDLPVDVATLVVAEVEDLGGRIRLSSLGASRILPPSAEPAQVVQTTRLVASPHDGADVRVLALDDDPDQLEHLRRLLGAEGIDVEAVEDPAEFWPRLVAVAPDLVILDERLPGVSGLELCRVLRSDARWCNIPIVFLTVRDDPGFVEQVFIAGADDYVRKPLIGPELVARVRNRVERARLLRQLADVDPLTGVSNRRHSEELLHQLLGLSARSGSASCVAVIDLDGFKEINDIHGHASGDLVLRRVGALLARELRGHDVIGRWGGDEFVVGLYPVTREVAEQRLAAMLDRLAEERFVDDDGAEFSVRATAGVAEFPSDGVTLTTLYRAADRALYRAKAH